MKSLKNNKRLAVYLKPLKYSLALVVSRKISPYFPK